MIARLPILGWLLLATLALGVVNPDATRGQGAEPVSWNDAHQPPLKFRRIYAPHDRLDELPCDHDRLVPMPADEFERLVSVLRASSASNGLEAGIASARYQARLEGDRLVEGKATLEVFHSVEGEVLLPLEPCRLAISEAEWIGPKPRPAVVGSADDGSLTLVVARRGRLRLAWSLAGQRDESGAIVFPIELPTGGATQLVLDMPIGMTPLCDQGIVTKQSAPDAQMGRWRIELGGRRRSRLRVVPDEQLHAGPKWTRLRQTSVYEFSIRGVEVSTDLHLDAYGEPLDRVVLRLDPGLQLVTAQYGSTRTPVPWAFVSPTRPGTSGTSEVSSRKPGGSTRVVLQFPEPIQGTERLLRLVALVPLVLENRWELPGIHPEGMFWQEGTASLRIPDPELLILDQLAIRDGRQSKTGSHEEIQYFSPDAAVEVVLRRPQTPMDARLGTTVELGGRRVAALATADLELAWGKRFELDATIGRRWIVDSVDSVPADALDDWTVRKVKGGRESLRIRLAKPLSPSRPIRLLIRAGRLDVPLSQSFTGEELVPVAFPTAKLARQLTWLRPAETHRLEITGADASAHVDPQTLDAEDLALFAESPRDPLLEHTPRAATWQVAIQPRKPAYSAEIRVEASVSDGVLHETYRVNCVPQSARVQYLLVRFSQTRDVPLRWMLGAEGENQLVAELLPPLDAEDTTSLGETWRLDLRPPRSVPFEIRASRAIPLKGPLPVSLACVPEAAEQRATVVVGSSGNTAARIENHHLEPIPTEPEPDDRINPIRASYRYDPVRDTLVQAALTVAREAPDKVPPSAWAWNVHLQSRIEPSGTAEHLAVYYLQSTGRREIRFDLPLASSPDAIRGVWIDGSRVAWRPLRDDTSADVRITLPRQRKYPVVAIHFQTAGPRLAWLDSTAPAFPTPDLPVIARRWTAWLPPDYEPCNLGASRLPLGRTLGWAERLFGPLGRRPDQHPWDPARMTDLSALVEAGAGAAVASERPVLLGHAPDGPWDWAETADFALADTVGWNACDLEIPDAPPARLGMVRRDAMQAIGWGVFLVTLSLAWWLAIDRPVLMIVLAGLFGVTALTVPQTYAGLASNAFLAVLACLGIRLIRRRTRPSDDSNHGPLNLDTSQRPPSPARDVIASSIFALAVLLTLAMSDSANGQPVAAAGSAVTPTHNVFIPVDESDQPTGDMYQVPESLYRALLRRAADAADGPRGWLLIGAEYQGTLSRESPGGRLVLERLVGTFDVRVFGDRRTVELPLGGEAVSLATDEALLDGRPVQPRWLEHEGLLAIDLDGDGPEYRIELPLHPTLQTDGTHASFDLRIPSWAGSRFELSIPADVPRVEIPSATGLVVRQDDPRRLVAELGPSDRLTVRWPEGAGRELKAPAIEVDELLWLKVRDGSVVLDGRFRFSPTQGYLDHIEFLAAPRLRLQPWENGGRATLTTETTLAGFQKIRFDLIRPTTEPVTLEVSFLLLKSSGVGKIRLPHLAALGARSTKRWLAVWLDPSLDSQDGADLETFSPLPPDEFEAAWGSSELRPRAAYVLPPGETAWSSGETAWSIKAAPRDPKTTATESLTLIFGEDDIEADYSANITVTAADGYRFQYRIAAPKSLEVESISLVADSIEQVARWSRDLDGSVTVFLAEPVSGEQQLTLHGRLTNVGRERMPLPVVRLEGVETESGTIDLLRKPAVGLEVVRLEGLQDIEDRALDSHAPNLGHLFRSFRYAGPGPVGGTVAVTANRPEVQGRQTTLVRFDGEYWEAEIFLDLTIDQGVLDMLQLSVPDEFAGPYKLDPPATVEPSLGPEGYFVVRPPAAPSGKYRLRILSPLEFGPGDRVRVPQVTVEGIELSDHLLILPTQLHLKPAVWETQGLREAPLPQNLSEDMVSPSMVSSPMGASSWVAFRVEAPSFEAVLRPVKGVARVHLADIRMAWRADGGCWGTATLDLEPAGLSECVLQLPAEFQWVAVAVADVPVAATLLDAGRWRVPLGPGAYPRRIDAWFAGQVSRVDADQRRTIKAPRVEGVPVLRTLWTVSGPAMHQRGEIEGFQEASLLEQTWLRIEHIRKMIQTTTETTSDEREESDHWCRLWADRFLKLRHALENQWQQTEQGDSAAEAWAELVSIDTLPPRIGTLIESREEPVDLSPQGPWSDRVDGFRLGAWPANQTPLRCVTDGEGNSITVLCRPTEPGWLSRRLLAPAILAALTLLAALAARSGLATTLLHQWPHAAGVAVGLGWWLWLRPSFLGWLIVAASLVSLFRSGWKRQRPTGSVILPYNGNEVREVN